MYSKEISCLFCVSASDLHYLFEYSFSSCLRYINFISEIFIVTPQPKVAARFIHKITETTNIPISILADRELLSNSESKMCGWSKQQILKLRSYELSKTANTLSIGADTITLSEISLSAFLDTEHLIINYRNHKYYDKHLKFEVNRVRNIFKLLGLNLSEQDNYLRDYIFDIFLFNNNILQDLNKFLINRFGPSAYNVIFPSRVTNYDDMGKIGEWSLYTIFAIKVIKNSFEFRDATALINQLHSENELQNYQYNHNAVHFVRKDFNVKSITKNLKLRGIL